MSLKLADIITGAAFRADLSVVTPSSSDRVTQYEWAALAVKAIKSVWVLAASARPDFQVTSADFTISSGGAASFPVPSDFYDIVDVVFAPDTAQEYSLSNFAWQNRRSPGGWFPANFGGITSSGGASARLMGGSIYIEPSLRAGGTYRLWYCPRQKAAGPWQARLASVAALPTCVAAGNGIGKTLTATANGALTVDGVAAAAGDRVLIKTQASAIDNGLYTVTNAGSAGSQWILARVVDYDEVSEIGVGDVVFISAGNTQTNALVQLASWGGTVDNGLSTSAMTFTSTPVLDQVLDPFGELIELLTAIPVMVREDDLDPTKLILRAFGADGQSGLVGDLKEYFGRVKTANSPGKMVDTDARGPRSPWAW